MTQRHEHPAARTRLGRTLAIAVAAGLAACAFLPAGPESATVLARRLQDRQALLLGEVHDNPIGHRWRFELLQHRVADGWRPAIAMEQFDRERQPNLDRAMRSCSDADCVIRAAAPANARWDWALYKPVIALALQHRLALLAANVSRTDAARVVREGVGSVFDAALISAYRLDQPLPQDLAAGLRHEIDMGHCGKLPAQMLPGMVQAQVARDVWMAELVREHAPRGIVLLAGNAHVRRDLGVPRWLAEEAVVVVSVGYAEEAAPEGAYDVEVRTPGHARPDACAGL